MNKKHLSKVKESVGLGLILRQYYWAASAEPKEVTSSRSSTEQDLTASETNPAPLKGLTAQTP